MSILAKARWAKRAEALGRLLPKERLHPAVLLWAEQHAEAREWAIAFSGGADSLVLLLLLWAHWPERRARWRVLHFNHRLRGRASGNDERFCRSVCAALGMRCRVGRWKEVPPQPSEADARDARHRFFARELTRGKATSLWLGHQLDDVAETMLMRLARGSGTAGLCAPRPVQSFADGRIHLRPLLTLQKKEIARALELAGIPWREDATNQSDDFLRNRIRAKVIPAWCRASGTRDALAGAALARELLSEDDQALEAWLLKIAPIRKDGALNLHRLAGAPRAICRRALHLWLGQKGGGVRISRQAFERLLDDVQSASVRRHSIGAGTFAEVRRDRVVFVEKAVLDRK